MPFSSASGDIRLSVANTISLTSASSCTFFRSLANSVTSAWLNEQPNWQGTRNMLLQRGGGWKYLVQCVAW